ncbi:MAG: outer membrane protein assembly factor BamE [Bdellovibrionales bacterium]|nr:outer membrane protein assembly factor BamE [Bdellovibrionales bacterium]
MKLRPLVSFLLVSCGLVLMPSCSTPPHVAFERVQLGDEKADVLEVMGSPQRTRRSKGQDEWIYIFRSGQEMVEREVLFQDGKVVAVQNSKGQSSTEQKVRSAESLDQLNAVGQESASPAGNKGFKDLDAEGASSDEPKSSN